MYYDNTVEPLLTTNNHLQIKASCYITARHTGQMNIMQFVYKTTSQQRPPRYTKAKTLFPKGVLNNVSNFYTRDGTSVLHATCSGFTLIHARKYLAIIINVCI